MAKVTILKTNKGTKILGTMQCSNGVCWDAEGCYRYCNLIDADLKDSYPHIEEGQAFKLLMSASNLGNDWVDEEQWWKNRDNFMDAEIDYDVEQSYQSL